MNSEFNGTKAGISFYLRSVLKEQPLIFLSVCLFVLVVFFGLLIRIYERGIPQVTLGEVFEYYWNAFWLVIITMTTVGYGDIVPRTHVGRFINMFACVMGTFLISFLTVSLMDVLLLKDRESAVNFCVFKLNSAMKKLYLRKNEN